MITSQEVNAMIAMQQQQLSGMGGVQQVGAAYPQSGMSQYPPQFSYGVGVGHGGPKMASSFAMAAMGVPARFADHGIGVAGQLAGAAGLGAWAAGKMGATGVASAFGKVAGNGALNFVGNLDPTMAAFTGASAGWGTAAAGGAGILGRVGGAAAGMFSTAGLLNPAMLAAQAAIFAGTNMYRGHQQQSQIGASLNQAMPFANSMAGDGRGFSATQVNRITSGVRALDMADPFASMRDLTNLTSKFTEMGMAEGVRSAEEFSKKFSAMKTAVSRIAKTLGTTLEQAGQAFAGLRSAGLYTAGDVTGMSSRMRMMQGMGMGQGTFMQAAAGGAGMAQQSGMARRSGALAATSLGDMFMTGSELGMFSGEDLMDATGAGSGSEGAAMLGQQTTASMIGFLQNSSAGQAVLLALGEKDKNGRYTGKINKSTAAGLSNGSLNINNLSETARTNLGNSKDARLSFTNRSADIAADLMSQEDPTLALSSIVKSVAGDRYGEMNQDDLVELLLKNMAGLDRKQAQLFAKAAKEGDRIRKERRAKIRGEMNAEFYEQDMRMNHSLEGSMERFKQGLSDVTVNPVQRFGAGLSTGIENLTTQIGDAYYNRERIVSTESTRSASMRDALTGTLTTGTGSDTQGIAGALGLTSADNLRLARGDFSSIDNVSLNAEEQAQYQSMVDKFRASKRRIADAQNEVGKGGLFGTLTERDVLGIAMNTIRPGTHSMELDRASPKERMLMAKALKEVGLTKVAKNMAQAGGAIGSYEAAAALRTQAEDAFSLAGSSAGQHEGGGGSAGLGGLIGSALYNAYEGTTYEQLQGVGASGVAGEIASKNLTLEQLLSARDEGLQTDDVVGVVNKRLGTSFTNQEQFDKVIELYRGMGDTKEARSAFGLYNKNTSQLQKGQDFLELATSLAGSTGSFDSKEFDQLRAAASDAAAGRGGDVYGNVDAFLASAASGDLGELGAKGSVGQAAAEALALKNAISGAGNSRKDLQKLAGLSDEDIDALAGSGLNLKDGVTDDERADLAKRASRKTFLERFQSGGGIVTEGVERTQIQLAQEMQKLSQSTEALANAVNGGGSSGVSIKTPIGSFQVGG